MDTLLLLKALLLGVIEGLTEFLPVSSTGHLIIFGDLLNFTGERAKSFEIFIQLGSILGVVWFYHQRLWQVARNLHRPQERRFVINLLIAFLPAVILGLLLHHTIKTYPAARCT
ncbi:MAG: undecaprenyl-diphosphatase [Halothiobacillaceae bacterium]|nr:MAG: undecaprenyl-diphosphatase [Halothiobacillaceae bacterium]